MKAADGKVNNAADDPQQERTTLLFVSKFVNDPNDPCTAAQKEGKEDWLNTDSEDLRERDEGRNERREPKGKRDKDKPETSEKPRGEGKE